MPAGFYCRSRQCSGDNVYLIRRRHPRPFFFFTGRFSPFISSSTTQRRRAQSPADADVTRDNSPVRKQTFQRLFTIQQYATQFDNYGFIIAPLNKRLRFRIAETNLAHCTACAAAPFSKLSSVAT